MCDELVDLTNYLAVHLEKNKLKQEQANWKLNISPLGDRGLFANKDIQPGEIIFIDSPLILGPRPGIQIKPKCTICFRDKNLRNCTNGCRITICSDECQNTKKHFTICKFITEKLTGNTNNNLTRYSTPIQAIFLNKTEKALLNLLKQHSGSQHGFEVDKLLENGLSLSNEEVLLMKTTCSVLDANAFTVVTDSDETHCFLRGLYPLASLANHSCTPNATHVFNGRQQMVVKATKFIREDEEIFHSYVRFLWNTPVRRYHLEKTKHFLCCCKRCLDKSEFNSNLSALFCERCKSDILVPNDPLDIKTDYSCQKCNFVVSHKKIGFILSAYACRLNSFQENDIEEMLNFLDKKLLPTSNHIIVELKLKVIWSLGYVDNYKYTEMSDNFLNKKENLCREILNLLEILQTGKCKMRGLLLYEVSCCLKERHRRIKLQMFPLEKNNNYTISQDELQEIESSLKEASEILEYDISAPHELKSSEHV